MLLGEIKMESIGIAPEIRKRLTRYSLKFELNWSLTNAPRPDEIVLDEIKSDVVQPPGLKREGMTLPLKIFDPAI